jgi:hypothetical protein
MQIDRLNGETAKYNNSASLYNTYLLEYKRYYNKTHMPLDITRKGKADSNKRPSVGISDAEFEKLKRDVYAMLSDDVDEVVSPDKLYDIVVSYASNNTALLKGADGKTPVRGVDYYTDDDFQNIVEEVQKLENANLSKAYSDIAKLTQSVSEQSNKTNEALSVATTAMTDVSFHKDKQNNPHKVTAEQVGAYTKAEVDKKLENIDVSIDIDKELNASSDNPIANSAVAKVIGDIDEALDGILSLMEEYAPTGELMPDGEEQPIM